MKSPTPPRPRRIRARPEIRPDSGDVARIRKRRAVAAGLIDDFAGLSPRGGFITNAAKKIQTESIKCVMGQRRNTIVPPLLEIVR